MKKCNWGILVITLLGYSLPRELMADDLPNYLSLRCEGTLTTKTNLPRPELYDERFNLILQLRDRVLTNVTENLVIGRECILNSGDVDCELDATRYYEEFNSTMVQHAIAFVTRKTGEFFALLQTVHFDGQGVHGEVIFKGSLGWRGVCGKGDPIF